MCRWRAAAGRPDGLSVSDESLHYSINWPSGLSLGEATFTAHQTARRLGFRDERWMRRHSGLRRGRQVSLLGHRGPLLHRARSRTQPRQPARRREKTTFDQKTGTAHPRHPVPDGGGKSDFDIASCARDALTFLYYRAPRTGPGPRAAAAADLFRSALLGPHGIRRRAGYHGRRESPPVTDRLTGAP